MALSCYAVVRRRTGADRFVVYQSDFLSHLQSRFAIPLVEAETRQVRPALRLNPIFDVDGVRMVLFTEFALALRCSELVDTGISLASEADRIREALDFLTLGF